MSADQPELCDKFSVQHVEEVAKRKVCLRRFFIVYG